MPSSVQAASLQPLTQKSLALAARQLAARDKTLARIHATHGDPPLWRRATGFPTLVHIILEQQVSLKSAKSMLLRLETAIEPFSPLRFLELGDTYLRSLGVTRQKSAYLLDLSASVAGSLAESLKDPSADVRRLVADVLGFSRDAAVIPALVAATKDSDPDVAAAAQQAIDRLKLPEPRASRGDGAPATKV